MYIRELKLTGDYCASYYLIFKSGLRTWIEKMNTTVVEPAIYHMLSFLSAQMK